MKKEAILNSFWRDVARQDATALKTYFTPTASICWHNSNECFNVDEYIIANCEYPGEWQGEIERLEECGLFFVTVTRVWLSDMSASFHVTSFFEFSQDKISKLDEYWGDDGVAPQWRLEKKIGKPIH